MNDLRLSSPPLVIPSILRDFIGKTTAYKSYTVALNSYLGLSAFSQKNFLVCIKFDKGGNSLPKHFERTANIRSNL